MAIKNRKIFTYQNIIILASILPIILFGFLTYQNSTHEYIQNSFSQIKNINKQKEDIVKGYFEKVRFDIENLSKTISFLEEQASLNIINIQTLQRSHLKEYYNLVQNNILSLAKKDIFQYIFSFKNKGRTVNKSYIDEIYGIKNDLGIKNVLMINKKGKVLYSSDNKLLEGKNISQLSKPLKKIFKKVKTKKFQGKKSIYFTGFGYCKISKSYKQFVISPFKDVDGFIAIEIDQKPIQKIIENIKSLGGTAETYLTYKQNDKTFLASNRVIKHGKIGDKKDNVYVKKGFNTSGIDVKYGSIGAIELVGYMPVKIKNITFSMQTTVAYAEVISPTINGIDYFENFIKDYNYQNVLLIGSKGDVFYSVKKDDALKTNLLNGKYSNTSLAKAVKKVFKTKSIYLTDINFYELSQKKLAQFALIPILSKNDNIKSIVVVELNLKTLSKKLMTNNKMYKTIETYVVGRDKRLRTDTTLSSKKYNLINSYKENLLINTDSVKDAFKYSSGSYITKDYRGVKVLSSFNLIECKDFKWAIITKVDEGEIITMLKGLKFNILLFIFIFSIVALFIMFVITNQKKKHDENLIYHATHDSLTELPNRKFALEFLSYKLANSKRNQNKGAVLFIDLDRFKFINDSYGHKAGDLVLKEVSQRLKKVLRKEDLLARLGGDEFILIVNDFKTISNIDTLCKKIIKNISQPIKDEQRNYKINLSIGVAIFPNDSNSPAELLQFADTAMFKTKDQGRNGYTYYSKEMTEKSLKISRVETDLKKAIEKDELVLYYQPQINIKTDKIVGVEALIRWAHPKDGLIMPNDFIAIAEESNLIIDLGTWVTTKACESFKAWKDMGYELEYIAVNMSSKQIQCNDCIKTIENIIEKTNFKPQWLELEITENILISNFEHTLSNINQIKEMGIKFSIDDFGTGYSSLSYLKSLPISTLKIDREFIKDILTDKDDLAIVSATIAMGHTLNYNIIAEGAEDLLEVELLKTLNCDMIQGYYYSKPLCEKDLLEYFDKKMTNGGGNLDVK